MVPRYVTKPPLRSKLDVHFRMRAPAAAATAHSTAASVNRDSGGGRVGENGGGEEGLSVLDRELRRQREEQRQVQLQSLPSQQQQQQQQGSIPRPTIVTPQHAVSVASGAARATPATANLSSAGAPTAVAAAGQKPTAALTQTTTAAASGQ